MNESRDLSPFKILALIAIPFGAMVTTVSLPAYSQQEVDPTWYDPWAARNTVVLHSSQPQVAIHRHQRMVKSVSSARSARKVRGKRPTSQPRPS